MHLRDLTIFEFDAFAFNHPLGSYHQTSNYALLASEKGLDYNLIGMVDENNNIIAAALILIKKINMFFRYGYAPKGFLINYYDRRLVETFFNLLKKRYFKQNISFVKFNPEIAIGEIKKKQIIYNQNNTIKKTILSLNCRELQGNKKFSTKLPKYNSVILLQDADIKKLSKKTRNKIHKTINYKLEFVKGSREDIPIIYNFIKKKKNKSINHYYNYYNAFNKNESIDIFLVKVNFEECLINLRKKYEEEYNKNTIYNEKVMQNPSEENLNTKLVSDKKLNEYKNYITQITNYLSIKKEEYIAGAITIKYKNRVSVLISGFDQKYRILNANYFLHYKLIEFYKKDYTFLDLNGISGDFSDTNPYKGLNEFKLGFNPKSFEYIGEFDFIINEGLYSNMEHKGVLAQEFKKQEKVLPTK